MKHREPLVKHHETCNTLHSMRRYPALDVETSAYGLDAETSVLCAKTSALGTVRSAIARSYRRYRRGVSGDIGAEFPAISAIAELV